MSIQKVKQADFGFLWKAKSGYCNCLIIDQSFATLGLSSLEFLSAICE